MEVENLMLSAHLMKNNWKYFEILEIFQQNKLKQIKYWILPAEYE